MPFEWGVFGTVFGVIFVAELPDKTAVAALLLATKYRPVPVFLGAALALAIQSVVAVAAGGVLSLLPARPVHIGAGVVMLVSAVVMWRRKSSESAESAVVQQEKRPPTFLRAFIATFSLIFVAEWGDLTQLGTAALAARYRSPLTVFAAATLALWAVAALAILVGNRARALMNPELTKRVAAVVFLGLGIALVAGLL
jgi:putative Ca2+/H+ antiporter (TMEM165/GDT1 family)